MKEFAILSFNSSPLLSERNFKIQNAANPCLQKLSPFHQIPIVSVLMDVINNFGSDLNTDV